MKSNKVNLFVYGSLRDHNIFHSVCGLDFSKKASRTESGEILLAEPAFLSGYRRVSPDNVYYYAIASETSRTEGLVIYDIPTESMAVIDKYEGQRYQREVVVVNTAHGAVKAQAYLASHDSMKKHFAHNPPQ